MEMGNRICPACGSDNAADSKFCKECGTDVLRAELTAAPTRTLEMPARETASGTLFAGRYRVIETLGTGGMGQVFRVHDEKLDEEVALKLIRPELALDPRTLERFGLELKTARKIVHKNVGRVYELMEDKGRHFITMEYVRGRDLKDILGETGRLAEGRAVSIARQVCDGLAEAHRTGVVHRDLKPANIMIDEDGQARIMDFGIARSVRARGVTAEGVVVGTPDYMSPEQVEGKDVDGRSDIYSLGVVLYEMVTGRLPFSGETPLAVALKHKTEAPRDPREIDPTISEGLGRSILKCLEKDRADRYQSASELGRALAGPGPASSTEATGRSRTPLGEPARAPAAGRRRALRSVLVLGAAGGLLALAIFAGLRFLGPQREAFDSIAVLPFENADKDPSLEAYCSGIPDAVREDLAQTSRRLKDASRRLKVISRSSMSGYRGQAVDPKRIGRDLDVRTILTGAVARQGDRLLVRTELTDTADGSVILERSLDREVGELFTIQDVIFAAVLDGLGVALTEAERQAASTRPVANVKAYEYYLKAMSLEYTDPGLGMKFIQNALDITGDNAFLFAAMAEVGGTQMALFDSSKGEDHLARAEAYANKALALDPGHPWAHVVLGYLFSQFRGDQLEALRHFKLALAGDPEDPRALEGMIITDIGYLGKFEEAAALAGRLKAVDPRNWCNGWASGGLEFYAGRFGLALEPWRKMSGASPDSPNLFWYAVALIYNKKLDEAHRVIDQNARDFPDSVFSKLGLLWKAALLKDEARVAEVLSGIEEACRNDADSARNAGVVMALMGEPGKALNWLQIAVDRGFLNYAFLENDPFLEGLRGEERFKTIVAQAKRDFEALPD